MQHGLFAAALVAAPPLNFKTTEGLMKFSSYTSPHTNRPPSTLPTPFAANLNMRQRSWLGLLKDYDTNSNTIRASIKEAQRATDGELWAIVQNVEDGKHTEFSVDDDSVVWFEDRLCVPNDQALR
ncbi:hypothetical protein Tco_1203091 [Tanacetum coccineum]